MAVIEKVEQFIGSFYTHFVYRDLAYIGGGLLVLAVPFKAYSALNYFAEKPWWFTIPVVIVAYALGFFAQEASVACKIFRMFPATGNFVDQEVKSIRLRGKIAAEWGESALLRLERIILLKHMSAVLGSSSIIAFLNLQVYFHLGPLKISCFTYVFTTIVLLLVAAVMLIRNWRASSVQDKLIEGWAEDIRNPDGNKEDKKPS